MLKIVQNRALPNSFEIKHFLECRKCAETCPAGMSMQKWVDIQVGLTPWGIQVWCVRHKANITHIDFRGQRLAINATAAKELIWPVTV